MDSGYKPSIEILERIAEYEGTDPLDLPFVLTDWINPEALDRLVMHARESADPGDLQIDVEIAGYAVAITAHSVVVTPSSTAVATTMQPMTPLQPRPDADSDEVSIQQPQEGYSRKHYNSD